MLIDYVDNKKSFLSYNEIGLSTGFDSNFSTKETLTWVQDVARESWFKLNFVELIDLKSMNFVLTMAGDTNINEETLTVEISNDNIVWEMLFDLSLVLDGSGNYLFLVDDDMLLSNNGAFDIINQAISLDSINKTFQYVRFTAKGFDVIDRNLSITNLTIFGEVSLSIPDDYISINRESLAPQKFFEASPLLPNLIEDYLVMLEESSYNPNRIPDETEINFDFSSVLSQNFTGAINEHPINTVAINGVLYDLATTFSNQLTFNFYINPTTLEYWTDTVYRISFGDGSDTMLVANLYQPISHTYIEADPDPELTYTYYVTLSAYNPNGLVVERVHKIEITGFNL